MAPGRKFRVRIFTPAGGAAVRRAIHGRHRRGVRASRAHRGTRRDRVRGGRRPGAGGAAAEAARRSSWTARRSAVRSTCPPPTSRRWWARRRWTAQPGRPASACPSFSFRFPISARSPPPRCASTAGTPWRRAVGARGHVHAITGTPARYDLDPCTHVRAGVGVQRGPGDRLGGGGTGRRPEPRRHPARPGG